MTVTIKALGDLTDNSYVSQTKYLNSANPATTGCVGFKIDETRFRPIATSYPPFSYTSPATHMPLVIDDRNSPGNLLVTTGDSFLNIELAGSPGARNTDAAELYRESNNPAADACLEETIPPVNPANPLSARYFSIKVSTSNAVKLYATFSIIFIWDRSGYAQPLDRSCVIEFDRRVVATWAYNDREKFHIYDHIRVSLSGSALVDLPANGKKYATVRCEAASRTPTCTPTVSCAAAVFPAVDPTCSFIPCTPGPRDAGPLQFAITDIDAVATFKEVPVVVV